MSYTQEQLREAYRKLPQKVQEAIFSVDSAEIIREIGEKHKLMIDKIGEMADETGLVMLGFVHPRDFIPHLAERLEISQELAKEIGEEINSRVFFPIRENLKKIHEIEAELPEPTAQPAAPVEPLTPPEPPGIFEAKTKEGIFRQPLETTEKIEPAKPGLEALKKIDPYREPVS